MTFREDVRNHGEYIVHGESVRLTAKCLLELTSSSTALDSYVAELGNDISYDKRYAKQGG
jgi:hypothetical protein